MTSSEERETLINEISNLQSQQLTSRREAAMRGWRLNNSLLAFDMRNARITSLVRRLAELDGLEQATRPPMK